jgi:carbon-monoxide dehydrogenase large subunit
MPYANPAGLTYDSGDFPAAFESAAALADWRGFAARREESRQRGRHRGIGIANYVDLSTGSPQERAEVTVDPAGVVDVVIGTQAYGQGHETSYAQVVADLLEAPFDSVRLRQGDTDFVKAGGGSHSGRSMRLGAIILTEAAKEIIAKGRRIAAHVLEAAEADVSYGDGRFVVTGTDRSLGLFEAAEAALRADLPDELRGPLAAASDINSRRAAFGSGCHVAEVEVDAETGVVEIVRYSAVDDVGRAINPLLIDGQTHGGVAQGIGQALMERCAYDPASGQMLAASFMDYALPRADHAPFFDTVIAEVPTPTNPLGVKPGSEGGTSPSPAAIVNAIVDALSGFHVAHVELPATPERVWQAMRKSTD